MRRRESVAFERVSIQIVVIAKQNVDRDTREKVPTIDVRILPDCARFQKRDYTGGYFVGSSLYVVTPCTSP